MRPVRAKALKLLTIYKAFALTGRHVCEHDNPGRCPGLRASAPSGRVGQKLANLQLFVRPQKSPVYSRAYHFLRGLNLVNDCSKCHEKGIYVLFDFFECKTIS